MALSCLLQLASAFDLECESDNNKLHSREYSEIVMISLQQHLYSQAGCSL